MHLHSFPPSLPDFLSLRKTDFLLWMIRIFLSNTVYITLQNVDTYFLNLLWAWCLLAQYALLLYYDCKYYFLLSQVVCYGITTFPFLCFLFSSRATKYLLFCCLIFYIPVTIWCPKGEWGLPNFPPAIQISSYPDWIIIAF